MEYALLRTVDGNLFLLQCFDSAVLVDGLIKELERRGVYLDKDSRNRLIDFYQRLNVLEKKSDSGDALYVRSIL